MKQLVDESKEMSGIIAIGEHLRTIADHVLNTNNLR